MRCLRQGPLHSKRDHSEEARVSRLSLRGSSKLGRAVEDLEVLADAVAGIVKDLRTLAGE